jgi:hypothetical protein
MGLGDVEIELCHPLCHLYYSNWGLFGGKPGINRPPGRCHRDFPMVFWTEAFAAAAALLLEFLRKPKEI